MAETHITPLETTRSDGSLFRIRLWRAINQAPTANGLIERLALLTTGYGPGLEDGQEQAAYYDYPVLKQPFWGWEIIWYFFFGGLAAGSYIIATLASLFGSPDDHHVARTGYYLSLLAVLPCPFLLIKDLGRPERFLNMLRIFKVKSPMSMGVWGLVTFSLFSGVTALIQAARDGILGRWWAARLLAALPQKVLALPGAAFGTFLGGYFLRRSMIEAGHTSSMDARTTLWNAKRQHI